MSTRKRYTCTVCNGPIYFARYRGTWHHVAILIQHEPDPDIDYPDPVSDRERTV